MKRRLQSDLRKHSSEEKPGQGEDDRSRLLDRFYSRLSDDILNLLMDKGLSGDFKSLEYLGEIGLTEQHVGDLADREKWPDRDFRRFEKEKLLPLLRQHTDTAFRKRIQDLNLSLPMDDAQAMLQARVFESIEDKQGKLSIAWHSWTFFDGTLKHHHGWLEGIHDDITSLYRQTQDSRAILYALNKEQYITVKKRLAKMDELSSKGWEPDPTEQWLIKEFGVPRRDFLEKHANEPGVAYQMIREELETVAKDFVVWFQKNAFDVPGPSQLDEGTTIEAGAATVVATRKEVDLLKAGKACNRMKKGRMKHKALIEICEDYLTTHAIKDKPDYSKVKLANYISSMNRSGKL